MSRRSTNQVIGFTLILSLLSSLQTYAQHGDIFAGIGLASYSYTEMKDYQQLLLSKLQTQGVRGTVTEKFPAYYTYFAGMHKHWKQFSLGFELGHGSSGGRVYYEDYSGKYIGDQLIRNNYFAVSPLYAFRKTERFWILGGAKVTTTWSKAELNHSLTVSSTTVRDDATFQTLNVGVQPYLLLRYYLGDVVFIQGTIGYELQGPSELRKSGDHDIWLDDGKAQPVHLQGNGYRLGVGIGISFKKS